jgi:hypothetical protein
VTVFALFGVGEDRKTYSTLEIVDFEFVDENGFERGFGEEEGGRDLW